MLQLNCAEVKMLKNTLIKATYNTNFEKNLNKN